MYIETKRLIIRDFNENDVNALYRIKTDDQVLKYAPDFLELDLDPTDTIKHINHFKQLENNGDIDTWRCYAIENMQIHEVMGCLCFCKEDMLFEYELGWMMIGEFTKNGYASEAAEAYAEWFCKKYCVDYLIAVMDVDNPASFRSAEKAGFKLFEKRTVYDYSYNRYGDDYYYLRRYYSKCNIVDRFYGDSPYYGRSVKGVEQYDEISFL